MDCDFLDRCISAQDKLDQKTIWLKTFWTRRQFGPWHFGPEHFGLWQFGPGHLGPNQTLAHDVMAPRTFRPKTFRPQTFWLQTFQPKTFRPETFRLQTFRPQTFRLQTFRPQTFQPLVNYICSTMLYMWNLREDPGFELQMPQNLQPLLALLKNSSVICAFLANEALAVDLCLQSHFIKDAKSFLLFILNTLGI